jgi:coatomer protein complex subunit epsilon
LDEAEAALQQALTKDPKNAEAISNTIVLNAIAGKDIKQLKLYVLTPIDYLVGVVLINFRDLQTIAPNHNFLSDLQEKASLFDKAATKYSAKISA